MNQVTQIAQWSQQYGDASNGQPASAAWEKAKKALEEMQHANPAKAKQQGQKNQKVSEIAESVAPPGLADAPPPPPPPPPHGGPPQQYQGYNQGYYGQPGSYNMGGAGTYRQPGPPYSAQYGGYNGYGMPPGPRGPPTPGPYGPAGPVPGNMYRHPSGHGPPPGQYGNMGGVYGPAGPRQGYGAMDPRAGAPPPPPATDGQHRDDGEEPCSEMHPVNRPQPRPTYMFNAQHQQQQPYKNNNQSPGSTGIRFNLPKRNNMQQGNAFQNNSYPNSNNNHYMYEHAQQEQQPSAQSNQPQPQAVTKPSTSPPSATAVEDWPPALKDYVSRAFAAANTNGAKDEVEKQLKAKITNVFNTGRASIINWKIEPLPLAALKKATVDSSIQPSPIQQSMLLHANMMGVYGKQQQQPERTSRWEQAVDSRGPHRPLPHTTGPAIARRPRSPAGFRRRSRSSSRSKSYSRSRSRSPPSYKNRRRRKYSNSSSDSLSDLSSGSSHRGGYNVSRNKTSRRSNDTVDRNKNWRQNTPKKDQTTFQRKTPKKKPGKKMFYNEAVDSHKLQKRAARFAGEIGTKKQRTKPLTLQINDLKANNGDEELDWSIFTIVGTSTDIAKGYLRLTAAPDASTVRPISILRKSLQIVKDRWQTKHDYHYVCEQLKSIRQDLTVQTIRNEFCVHVYETHARIAMENGDHEEFNQCQTNLKLLYAEGMKGHETEFLAYRILYYIFTKNNMDMNTALMSLQAEHREDECIKHALKIRSAWALEDFHSFFRLYKNAPKMSGYLLDWFIERERTTAMKMIMKAYRPSIPVEFCQRELTFNNRKDCIEFLEGIGATLSADKEKVDCKVGLIVVEAQ